MRAIFDVIPDWVELAVLLFFVPFLARGAMKERARLRDLSENPQAPYGDRNSAARRLRMHTVIAPMFVLVYALLIMATTVQVIA